MKYFVNFSDFEEYQEVFQNKLDEFNDEIYRLFKSSQDVEWVGLGRDKTMNALYSQIDKLIKISDNLNKFLETMRLASNNYSEGADEVKSSFRDIADMVHDIKY